MNDAEPPEDQRLILRAEGHPGDGVPNAYCSRSRAAPVTRCRAWLRRRRVVSVSSRRCAALMIVAALTFGSLCAALMLWQCPEFSAAEKACAAQLSVNALAACYFRQTRTRPRMDADAGGAVERVWYDEQDRVHIRTVAKRCPRPHFVARAAGSSLSKLSEVTLVGSSGRTRDSTLTVFEPITPLRGTYIVDVILTTCSAFREGVSSEASLQQRCLFRPPKLVHRAQHVFSGSSSSSEVAPSSSPRGSWKLCVPALLRTALLDTRYQTVPCFNRSREDAQCAASIRDAYRYVRTPPRRERTSSAQYCFVGASHGRGMGKALARVLGTSAVRETCFRCGPSGTCSWKDDALPDAQTRPLQCETDRWSNRELEEELGGARSNWETYPVDKEAKEVRIFSALFVRDWVNVRARYNMSSCTHIFVHGGQWDEGWPEAGLPSASEFRSHLRKGLRALGPISALLSNNYNPLGDMILSCPPQDWRSPDVVDAYNAISEEVAGSLGVKFVDNNKAAIGPVWDNADDWAHYRGAGFDAAVTNVLWSAGLREHRIQ